MLANPPSSTAPSTAAMAELPLIRNKIPGADVLGFGFNVFNDYSTASLLGAVFRSHTRAATQWVSQASLAAFDIPVNVAVFSDTAVDGQVNVFQDNREYRAHLAAKAGVTGSGTTFMKAYSASFSATASTSVDVAGSSSHWLAVHEANYRAYRLALIDQSMAEAAPAFAQDPGVQNLPNYFSPAKQHYFFDVFARFGTHYVAEVEVGGFLNYYATVDKSRFSTAASVATQLSAEFKATMVKGQAEAEVKADAAATAWAESRSVQIKAGGGDTGPLAALHPMPGDDNSSVFESWQQSVLVNPSVMNFRLRPLSTLFSGDQARAVDQAIAAYTHAFIAFAAVMDYLPPDAGLPQDEQRPQWFARFSLIRSGDPVDPINVEGTMAGDTRPASTFLDPPRAIKWAFFKEDCLQTLFCKRHYGSAGDTSAAPRFFDDLHEDIKAAHATVGDRYIFAMSMLNMRPADFPPDRVAMMLRSCGMSLKPWLEAATHRDRVGTTLNGIFVGKPGLRPGMACEVYETFNPSALGMAELQRTVPLMPEQGLRGFGYRLMPATLG